MAVLFRFLSTSIKVDPDGIGTVKIDSEVAVRKEKQRFLVDGNSAEANDLDAVFLLDVERVNRNGKDYYSGYSVTLEEFKNALLYEKKLNPNIKFLVCIHGFNIQPSMTMDEFSNIKEGLKQGENEAVKIIPLLWPSEARSIADYGGDKVISKQAGKAFSAMIDFSNISIDISLMAHSMGNRALFCFAQEERKSNPDIKDVFEHIFMVAADVWEQVFNKDIINEKTWFENEFGSTGLYVANLAKNLHVLWHHADVILQGSTAANGGRNRLGAKGLNQPRLWIPRQSDLHPDIAKRQSASNKTVFDVEVQDVLVGYGWGHGYHAQDPGIKYYKKTFGLDV